MTFATCNQTDKECPTPRVCLMESGCQAGTPVFGGILAADTTNPKDAYGDRKPPLWLNPGAALLRMSRVFALGARKYGPYNWREKHVRHTVYLSAALRHIQAVLDGEDTDPESGEPHEAHAMACMALVLDARETGCLIDDRPPPGATGALISRMTEATP